MYFVAIKLVISVDCEIICGMLYSDIKRKLFVIVLKSVLCIKPPCGGLWSA